MDAAAAENAFERFFAATLRRTSERLAMVRAFESTSIEANTDAPTGLATHPGSPGFANVIAEHSAPA
jgi:hypothetical protein